MHKLPMHQSPRCLAKTRSGGACQSPIVRGKKRCRMHGGAAGSGAQPGNRNALRHGRYTVEAVNQRKVLRALIRYSRRMVADLA